MTGHTIEILERRDLFSGNTHIEVEHDETHWVGQHRAPAAVTVGAAMGVTVGAVGGSRSSTPAGLIVPGPHVITRAAEVHPSNQTGGGLILGNVLTTAFSRGGTQSTGIRYGTDPIDNVDRP
jgi:hypothetical protein